MKMTVFSQTALMAGFAGLIGLGSSLWGAPAFPLQPSANGRYLVDQDKVPFLIQGDTLWMWHIEGALASTNDIQAYLDDRANRGFTTIQLMVTFKQSGIGTMADINGRKPFLTEVTAGSDIWKLNTPNQLYFDHRKWIVAECRQRGLLVSLSALWLGYGAPGFFQDITNSYNTEAVCYQYGQYLGQQFGSYSNVLWIHGGDRIPTAIMSTRAHRIMEGIQSVNPGSLHTAHWRRPPSPNLAREVAPFSDVNVEGIYSASLTYFGCLRNWNGDLGLPAVPAFMMESYYENQARFNPPGAWPGYMCRRQAYWSILSGAGHIFGNEYPAGVSSLNSPGAREMAYVKSVFANRAWHELKPDVGHSVVTSGWGTKVTDTAAAHENDTYVTAARTANGNLVMAYLPPTGTSARTVTVDMTKLSGRAIARWFNPATGAYTMIGAFENTGLRNFTTPGNNGSGQNDWLLILESTPGITSGNVIPPPRFIAPATAVLSYGGYPGLDYTLEHVTQLASPIAWKSVVTNTANTSGLVSFTNTSSVPENYFRIRHNAP